MAFQFLHADSFSLKAGKGKAGGNSVTDIIAEVTRDPAASPHVKQPQPPSMVYGVDPHALPSMCAEYAASMSSTFTRHNRKTGAEETVTRKMRADGLVMLGGVFSAPETMPAGDWPEYRERMVTELRKEFGDRLKSVQEHFDEPFRHCHFYIIPRPGEHFDQVHPGKRAAAQVKDEGGLKGAQNMAYIEAMRKWQDRYWSEVSADFGLSRLGPKRQRVTRAEWQAQQATLAAAAERMREAQAGMEVWREAEAKLRRQHEAVSARKAAVEAREKRVESVGGKVGLFAAGVSAGFVIALQAAKDWLIERSLWPGVKRSHEVAVKAQESIEKREKQLKEAADRVEALERQLDASKRVQSNVADLQRRLGTAKAELAKVEGYNAELATENNDLKRLLRNGAKPTEPK